MDKLLYTTIRDYIRKTETNTQLKKLYDDVVSLINKRNRWDVKNFMHGEPEDVHRLNFLLLYLLVNDKIELYYSLNKYQKTNDDKLTIIIEPSYGIRYFENIIDSIPVDITTNNYNTINVFKHTTETSFNNILNKIPLKQDKMNILYFGYGIIYLLEPKILWLTWPDKKYKQEHIIKITSIITNITKPDTQFLKDFSETYDNWRYLDMEDQIFTLLNDKFEEFAQQIGLDNLYMLYLEQINAMFSDKIRSKIRYIENDINDSLSSLKAMYDKLNILKLQQLNGLISKETFTKLIDYLENQKKRNYLQSYSFDISSSERWSIKLKTKMLPMIFIDTAILSNVIKDSYIYNTDSSELTNKKREALQGVVDGENTLWSMPIELQIEFLPFNTSSSYHWGYRLFDQHFNNGHIEYSCLGTFNVELTKALGEDNYAKFIALFIQYLQSIAPADTAGRHALRYCLIADSNNDIIWSDNNQRYTGYNINQFDYNTLTFKEKEETTDDANSQTITNRND